MSADDAEAYNLHADQAHELIDDGAMDEAVAKAQVHATLAVAAAIRDLTDAVWGAGSS